jgi:hypothetical protein
MPGFIRFAITAISGIPVNKLQIAENSCQGLGVLLIGELVLILSTETNYKN